MELSRLPPELESQIPEELRKIRLFYYENKEWFKEIAKNG